MIFFLTYGSFHSWLISLNLFKVRHMFLLPSVILISIILGFFLSKIPPKYAKKLYYILISLVSLLILYNVVRIVPIEIQKQTQVNSPSNNLTPIIKTHAGATKPDVYWLVFDEMAGLDVMRDYFNYPEIDVFKSDLEQIGFKFVEGSKSILHYTLHQIATRLNYERFPFDYKEVDYYPYISNNNVVNEFWSRDYVIAVLDETRSETFGIASKPEIPADFSLDELIKSNAANSTSFLGAFGKLVGRRTMLSPFKFLFKHNMNEINLHKEAILFVADELGKLDLPQPKFVYTHLLLPHKPFMFTEDGSTFDQEAYQNWNYYFGQYKFTLNVIRRAVTTILENADPENPPIIILQSDHGARNLVDEGYPKLEGYPIEYQGSIIYAVYAPMCPDMPLEDGIDPINTFPLVFNCLFDMRIPLQ